MQQLTTAEVKYVQDLFDSGAMQYQTRAGDPLPLKGPRPKVPENWRERLAYTYRVRLAELGKTCTCGPGEACSECP